MTQPLWKTVWQFLINMHLPDKPPVAFTGIYSREMKTYVYTKTCIWMFIAVRLIIVKNWKYLSTEEWKNRLWYGHTTDCYLATRENYWSVQNDMDESHLYFAQRNRSNAKGYILHDFFYVTFLISFKGLGWLEKNTGEFWRVLESFYNLWWKLYNAYTHLSKSLEYMLKWINFHFSVYKVSLHRYDWNNVKCLSKWNDTAKTAVSYYFGPKHNRTTILI